MSMGLKFFWMILVILIAGGLLYLGAYGVPSPGVDVRHAIDLETRFK